LGSKIRSSINQNSLLLDKIYLFLKRLFFSLIVVDYFVSQRRATPRKHLNKTKFFNESKQSNHLYQKSGLLLLIFNDKENI
jgi:hypothetical protein